MEDGIDAVGVGRCCLICFNRNVPSRKEELLERKDIAAATVGFDKDAIQEHFALGFSRTDVRYKENERN